MAHYAFINETNVVVEVIIGRDETEADWEKYYGDLRGMTCLRTSYNTQAGIHLENGIPFRKNYAGIGYTYDANIDAFIPPQPSPACVFEEQTCVWICPEVIE